MKGIKQFVPGLAGIALWAISGVAAAAVVLPFGWYLEGNLGKSYSYKIFPGNVKNTGIGWNIDGGEG